MGVLASADDVLITSSTRDVQRIAVLDGRELLGGELGDAARDLFARVAAQVVDPWPDPRWAWRGSAVERRSLETFRVVLCRTWSYVFSGCLSACRQPPDGTVRTIGG